MHFSDEEVADFTQEAIDHCNDAERYLMLHKNATTKEATEEAYLSCFTVLHNMKDGAQLIELATLKDHTSRIVSQYAQYESTKHLSEEQLTYFFGAIAACRLILQKKPCTFDYTVNVSATPIQAPAASPIQRAKPGSKVMIIDDEYEIVEILSELIGEAGFQTVSYTSPIRALESLTTEMPSAVLTDLKMPELNGYDVLKGVHEFDADLPVIYLSGHITKDVLVHALSFGVYGVIEKPFSPQHVLQLLSTATQTYRLMKLLNQTISFLTYQFSDLDHYLEQQGSTTNRQLLREQLRTLLETRRKLKDIKKLKAT